MFKSLPVLLASLLLGACQTPSSNVQPDAIIDTYIAIAQASYEDSLLRAEQLEDAVLSLLAEPNTGTLNQARTAWIAARVPYMQTEVFRFGNPVVDEWEVRVNATSLNPGLIDYVETTPATTGAQADPNNDFASANVIASQIIDDAGNSIDAAQISPQFLAETLHQIGGIESNVAIGYHVIEFLLWGQDLKAMSRQVGSRPATDYSLTACSNDNCDRRRDYLQSVTSLLVADLEDMVDNWQPGRIAYIDLKAKSANEGLASILTGMGSLAYGELAGERIRGKLLSGNAAEEHDPFSDNTHNSLYYSAKGIANVYLGQYERSDGSIVSGPALRDLIDERNPALEAAMQARLEATELALEALRREAESGLTFDTLIAANNSEGEAMLMRVVNALMEETRTIEIMIETLGLQNVSIRGSDSLNNI